MRASQLALVIQADTRGDIPSAFLVLAENLYILKTSDGCGMTDVTDVRKILEELAFSLAPQIAPPETGTVLPARNRLRLCSRGPKTLRQEQPRNWGDTT